MKRSIAIVTLFALALLVPFAGSAQADGDTFLDKVGAVLKRAVDAGKMDATDARKIYNAVAEKLEAFEDKIDAWKEKAGDCKDDDDEETDVRGDKDDESGNQDNDDQRGNQDEDEVRGDKKKEAKAAFRAGLRKAKADRKRARAKSRLTKVAEKLELRVRSKRLSVEKAMKKWASAERKCSKKLDETTLKRLKGYAEDLKAAVENGRITKLEAFKLWVEVVKKALAA